MLSSFLRSFDCAGGGAIGYVRRSLFVQCMLICILNGGENELELLEQVVDCFLNVISEMEVGEDKMRLVFSEKSMNRSDRLSSEYLKRFVEQSNVQESFSFFCSVRNSRIVRFSNCKTDLDPKIFREFSKRWMHRYSIPCQTICSLTMFVEIVK